MKTLSVLLFCFLSYIIAIAEPITTVSKIQAETLLARLSKEKYILSYCDCCNKEKAHWIQIESIKIETVQEENDLYSIRLLGTEVMSFESDLNGNFDKASIEKKEVNELISLNHFFIPQNGRAIPLAYILTLDAEKIESCFDFVYYPHITDNQAFENVKNQKVYSDYTQWYQENIEQYLINKVFLGVWEIVLMCEDAHTCKELPVVVGAAKVVFEENGKVSLNVGTQNDRGTWKLENGKLIVKDNTQATTVFGFRYENNILTMKYLKKENENKQAGDINIMKLKRLKQ